VLDNLKKYIMKYLDLIQKFIVLKYMTKPKVPFRDITCT
jgi:hypothetical protein